MLMMSALGAALVLTTSSETTIAANFRNAQEGLYAADAALELAMDHLGAMPDWNPILEGRCSRRSSTARRPGCERWPTARCSILARALNTELPEAHRLQCVRADGEHGAAAVGREQSGLAFVRLRTAFHLLPAPPSTPSTTSSFWRRTTLRRMTAIRFRTDTKTNAGSGVLELRAEAFGPRGTHQVIELTVARPGRGDG